MTYYATVDGVTQDTVSVKSDDSSFDLPGNVVVRFATLVANDKIINFGIFEGTIKNYSPVQVDPIYWRWQVL